jgi:transcriptional regulator with XRE-family HTH domain
MVRLEEARAARGLSQDALAELAAVGESTVGRIERGTTRPRPHVARRLAAALGLRPNDIEELRAVVAGARLREPELRATLDALAPASDVHPPPGNDHAPLRFERDAFAFGPPIHHQPDDGARQRAVVPDAGVAYLGHDDPGRDRVEDPLAP